MRNEGRVEEVSLQIDRNPKCGTAPERDQDAWLVLGLQKHQHCHVGVQQLLFGGVCQGAQTPGRESLEEHHPVAGLCSPLPSRFQNIAPGPQAREHPYQLQRNYKAHWPGPSHDGRPQRNDGCRHSPVHVPGTHLEAQLRPLQGRRLGLWNTALLGSPRLLPPG